MYFKPDEVPINEPPIIVSSIKNSEKSKLEENVDIPEVDKEEVIAKKTATKSWFGITKKLKKIVNIIINEIK